MKILDTFAAMLDLKAAEIRNGISLIEAVAADEKLTEMRMYGDIDDMFDLAIVAAKLGLTADDLEPMVRMRYLARSQFQMLARDVERYAEQLDPSAYPKGTQ